MAKRQRGEPIAPAAEPEPAPVPSTEIATISAKPVELIIETMGEQVVTLIAPEGVRTVGIQNIDPGRPCQMLKVDPGTGQVKVPARAAARLIEDHGFQRL